MITMKIPFKARAHKLLVLLGLLGLSASPFLNALTTRLLMLIFLSLTSFALSLYCSAFSSRGHEKEKINVLLLCMSLVFIVYIFSVLIDPIVFLKPEFVNEDMLIFNYEAKYDVSNGRLILFQSPNNHHVYYPLSYVFSKIVYDFTGSAYLVNWLLPFALIALLQICFVSRFLLHVKNPNFDNIALLIYSVSIFLIGYISVSSWNFRSIGCLVVLPLLISLYTSKNLQPNMITTILLVIAVIMSDPLYLPIGLLVFLLYFYYLTHNNKFLDLIRFILVTFLAYQSIIGFISYVIYGNYLPILKDELMALLNINPSTWVRTAVTERTVVYPLFDKNLIALSNLLIYGIIPLIMLIHFSKRVAWTKIAPLLLVLLITNALNISSRLIPNIFLNNIGGTFTYSLLPFSMLSLSFYMVFSDKIFLKDSGNIYWNAFKSKSSLAFKRQHLWVILLSLIIFSSSTNTISIAYPKSVNDPIKFIDDPRVAYYDDFFVANFLNNYWNGQIRVYYHVTSHFQEMFLKKEIRESLYQLKNENFVITLPMLQTVYNDKAEFYKSIDAIELNIIYNQGKWMLIYKGS